MNFSETNPKGPDKSTDSSQQSKDKSEAQGQPAPSSFTQLFGAPPQPEPVAGLGDSADQSTRATTFDLPPAEPGNFTKLFMSPLVAPAGVTSGSATAALTGNPKTGKTAVTAAAEKPTTAAPIAERPAPAKGSFTQMFGAPARPDAHAESAPLAGQPSVTPAEPADDLEKLFAEQTRQLFAEKPAAQTPVNAPVPTGNTQLFGAVAQGTPEYAAAGGAASASPQPKPASFTQQFGAPSRQALGEPPASESENPAVSTPAAPGSFTQMFGAPSQKPADEAALAAEAGGSATPSASEEEFARMFNFPLRDSVQPSAQPKPAAPVAGSLDPSPVTKDAPGEFTQFFSKGLPVSSPVNEAPKDAGSFTKLFNAPVAPSAPATPQGQGAFTKLFGAGVGSAPSANQSAPASPGGSFTKLFGAPTPPAPAASTPAAPSSDPFAKLFSSAAPAEPLPPAQAPAASSPGSFTQIFGRQPAGGGVPQAPASPQDPLAGGAPSGATQVFSRPPAPVVPVEPPQPSGPSAFTQIISGPVRPAPTPAPPPVAPEPAGGGGSPFLKSMAGSFAPTVTPPAVSMPSYSPGAAAAPGGMPGGVTPPSMMMPSVQMPSVQMPSVQVPTPQAPQPSVAPPAGGAQKINWWPVILGGTIVFFLIVTVILIVILVGKK